MRAAVCSIQLGSSTNLAVLAPVKPGFADAQETITYVERLQRLLDALHASRRNLRESELVAPAFPDTIGRFGVIQNFRYAIWPPLRRLDELKEPGPFHLSLNVSFDGGWEPYMRVIYRDIGPFLDALFCHCEGYPGASRASFDDYCRWVRANELSAGIYYNDSAATPGDAHYGALLERAQRRTTPAAAADIAAAATHIDALAQRLRDGRQTVLADTLNRIALPLRTLKGLYRLLPLFAGGSDGGGGDSGSDGGGAEEGGDGLVLRRFAQLALGEFRALWGELQAAPPSAALQPLLKDIAASLADELAWLATDTAPRPTAPERLRFDPSLLQDSMLNRADRTSHGALAMYGVRDAAQARALIASLEPLCGAPAHAGAIRHLVAITWPGLQALGLPAHRLDPLPPEFAEGMEARCGLLGDVRANHPNHWLRPLRHGAAPGSRPRIDLGVVHVVLLLRLHDAANPSSALHPQLLARAEALAAPGSGLKLLALQATRSRQAADGSPAREHFGFADGLSQPIPHAAPSATDEVPPGELLLGFRNQRGDAPLPAQADELLDHGSFLVVRKLQQRLDHLDEALHGVADAQAVKEKMMGRRVDGTPLVAGGSAGDNGFDYGADPAGRRCPLQSHVRRGNPRDGRAYTPRILRRGMSWGPAADEGELQTPRGVLFMAYCASIAEQFETIQGWMSGGNSSGLSSALADPLLGVPAPEDLPRVFRCFDDSGALRRVTLGDKPLVELQWGLYLFVPSRAALRALDAVAASAPPLPAPAPAPAEPTPFEQCRRWIEDTEYRAPALWAAIRREPGQTLHAQGYGTLVGGFDGVTRALRDDGRTLSVSGYGARMAATIGLNYLGQDAYTPAYQAVAPLMNPLIDAVGEHAAFDTALPIVRRIVSGMARLVQPRPGYLPSAPPRAAIDLVSLSEQLLAQLCSLWFGLPDSGAAPRWMRAGGWTEHASPPSDLPRCPGSIMSSSRTIFAPHPSESVVRRAQREGPRVREAVAKMIAAGAQGSLTQQIVPKLRAAGVADDVVADSIAGMLLGFPPTVHGNFLRTMRSWIEGGTLWQHQQALVEAPAEAPACTGADAAYERSRGALRRRLLDTMQEHPVPEMLWRCPVQSGAPVHDPARRVVLGVRSALADLPGPREHYDELAFGGSRDPASPIHGRHACPGYGMGVGVLLALLTGLFDAGTLRPTGSPVLLMLTPN
ncbi:MAG TPA: Dyp-type peroxidase [Rubrivivax sp.]|nr:Dyp-type peroxidase [Rubrivivax sp.]HPO17612.1 Dyp-type peroxidase [Rubrivivax sp.]